MEPDQSTVEPAILIYHATNALLYAEKLFCAGYHNLLLASDEEAFAAQIVRAEIVFGWRLPLRRLAEGSHLRWIQLMGAGVEDVAGSPHVPDHVTVTRVEGQFGLPIAEYVFGWVLHFVKEIDRMRFLQAERTWRSFVPNTLSGQTLAVAGLGSIGQEVARVGRAFGMRVTGLSRTGRAMESVDRHFMPSQWADFAAEADVLAVTLPHTADTDKVVNAQVFDAMKATAIFVNVGRGKVVDEEALLAAVRSEKIRVAVLDVFAKEPLAPESPLWKEPRVVVTPHLSGPSMPDAVTDYFLENLRRYLAGAPLLGMVDSTRGY